ncbi:helix-turn-helix domain-containing protein [Paracoccus sp. 22332]|uniref:helix-turn-helix domain-containing protein n=1 Tax=Paracoccus sp. 22332 TaxID=3453913 RepID=UPI003F850F6C
MTPSDIKDARRKLGLTQDQLAAVMGLRGKQTVSEWERGVKSPDGQSVRLIQAYLAGHRPDDWPKEE